MKVLTCHTGQGERAARVESLHWKVVLDQIALVYCSEIMAGGEKVSNCSCSKESNDSEKGEQRYNGASFD